MILKKHPVIKILSHVFLAVLVLNISVVLPRTEWMCDCAKHPERMSCCCNCPKCVAKRGGLLSYCHLSAFKDREKSETVVLKRAGCLCGLGRTVLNLPDNTPFITIQHADYFSHFPVYDLKTDTSIPVLDDIVLLPDHPG